MQQLAIILLVTLSTLPGWKEHVNKKQRYKISYPETWTPVKTEGGFAFSSPAEDEDDDFRENFNIVTVDLKDEDLTLQEFNDMALLALKKEKGDSLDYVLRKVMMGGQQATEVVYTTYSGRELKIKQCFTLYHHTGYIFTYGGEPDKFDLYVDIADKAVQSIKFLK